MNLCNLLCHTRGYAKVAKSRLSANVKNAGKGKTILAKNKRQQLSNPKPKTIKPTTLDMGDFLKLRGVSVEERTVHRNLLDKVATFSQLKIHPDLRTLLDDHKKIHVPTAIQKVAIKALRSNKEQRTWLLAAETGSGKTLSYMLPILSDLLTEPKKGPCLRSIILVPTLELLHQVGLTLNEFSCGLTTFSETVTNNTNLTKAIVEGLDVLVTTPDKLLNFRKHHAGLAERVMGETRHVVVDEADSLLNQSFAPSTMKVIEKCQDVTNLIFCTATIPSHFDKVLRQNYPETNRLITPSIHRLPRHIDFRVIDVWRPPYHDRKEVALQQAMYSIYNDSSEPGRMKRVVVFVNQRGQVEPLVGMLNKAGYNAFGIDGKLTPEERSIMLEDFVNPPKELGPEEDNHNSMKILIGTDLIARGIDMQKIRNVILYDQPWSAADLLHRAGRTGRLNSKGRVLLFVSRKDAKGWVKGLEKIVKTGAALA